MTGVWNEGEMSPGGREMATSSGEREERRPGLMTIAVLNCGGSANRPELSRTVPSRAEPYCTMQWKNANRLAHESMALGVEVSESDSLE